jgi:dihydroceramidase
MTWSLPFFPYPPAKDGYWEPVTSTLNWCEEVCISPTTTNVKRIAHKTEPALTFTFTQDYYATPYAAEIVNTLTNLLFMWLGVQGILSCRRNGHDQIFTVALLGYLVVGTGSFLFHSTLKCKLPPPPLRNRMSQLEQRWTFTDNAPR